jgi:organic hydroperoxide reductase OsmC/OhrA
VACAGVTLAAVATALSVPVTRGELIAEGDLDFSGTLGVHRDVPVGFSAIRLHVQLQTTAAPAQLEKLGQLTERYCVVAQSLRTPITVRVEAAV